MHQHIDSKIKAMKIEYHTISEMLMVETGFGWNPDLKCVEVETDDIWNKYLKKAPRAKGYRNKPVPNFDRYAFIFGKDHATGEGAEGPADAVENLEAEGNNETRVDEMNTSTSVTQAAKSQPSSRKRVSNSDSLTTSMKEMRSMIELCIGSMDKRMGDVAERLGQAKDLSKDRRRIIEELQKMTALTPRDQIAVARKIGERPDYVDLFFKQEFVAMLLEEGF